MEDGALTSENEEDKWLHVEMTDQREGLNSVIAHTLLYFLRRNLIFSLSCAVHSFSCLCPSHVDQVISGLAFAMSDGLRALPFSPRRLQWSHTMGNALSCHLVPVVESRRRPSLWN